MNALRLMVGALLLSPLACNETKIEATPMPEASVAAFDFSNYCDNVCREAARCGLDAARAASSKRDNKALADADKSVDEVERRCAAECRAEDPPKPGTLDEDRARICMKKTDCKQLGICLNAL
jgi:hypothetical protein